MEAMSDALIVDYVWKVTLILVLLSLSLFSTLVLLRVFSDYRLHKRMKRKKTIEHTLLIHLQNPLKQLHTHVTKYSNDMELVTEIAVRLLTTLKGEAYNRLLSTLQNLGIVEWGMARLQHNNKRDIVVAINILRHFSNNEIKEQFLSLFRNKSLSPLIRYNAGEALAQTHDIVLFPHIIKVLKNEDVFSAPLMSDIFQKFGNTISAQLATLLQARNTPLRIKHAALMALTHIGNTQDIIQAATPLCAHYDNELRALAFLALSHTGESCDSALIHKGVKDSYWCVRQHVAQCAANQNPVPVDILRTLLEDKNWLVGLSAGRGLYMSGMAGRKFLSVIAQRDSLAAQRARSIMAEHYQEEQNYGMA